MRQIFEATMPQRSSSHYSSINMGYTHQGNPWTYLKNTKQAGHLLHPWASFSKQKNGNK
jgi:hypothetical protein